MLPNEIQKDSIRTKMDAGLYGDGRKIGDVTVSAFSCILSEMNLKLWYDPTEEGCGVLCYKHVFIAACNAKEYREIFASEIHKCSPFEINDSINLGDIVLVSDRKSNQVYRGEIVGFDDAFEMVNVDSGSTESIRRNLLRKPSMLLRPLPLMNVVAKCTLRVLDCGSVLPKYGQYFTAISWKGPIVREIRRNPKIMQTVCKEPIFPRREYNPKKMEVCMDLYDKDGQWYRALCLDHLKNDIVWIQYLNYGNASKRVTRDKEFYLDESNNMKVPTMHVERRLRNGFLLQLDTTELELECKNSDLSMLIILPNTRTGLKDLEEKLKITPLSGMLVTKAIVIQIYGRI
uniref:Tudor domain-containing protein n=1 Tax=Glossina austeni TaxID=7395 RepID=A0A1A9VLH3_GLOAU